MTAVASPPVASGDPVDPLADPLGPDGDAFDDGAGPAGRAERAEDGPSSRGVGFTIGVWVLLLVLATLAVLYPLGPLFHQREQEHLLESFRSEVQKAADAKEGLAGLLAAEDPKAPEIGDPTAILDLSPLRVQQVVVEGVGSDQTRSGPGHVPGTAGLGQPGNSVVVGRRSGWGGPFDQLGTLGPGDKVVVTTTQGQTVYKVDSVEEAPLDPDTHYAPSEDDRLTLVTSASRNPLADTEAVIVVATLDGRPFEPTPQGGRTQSADGRSGSGSGLATLVLFGGGYLAAAAAAFWAYRRWSPLTAHLLTTPALVVMSILAAEAIIALLPAWA